MPAPIDAVRAAPKLFMVDANGDGRVTVGDAIGWLQQAFFLPGDWTLWAVSTQAAALARFLEVDAADYGGLASGIIAAGVWALGFVAIGMTWAYVKDLDRRVVRALVEWRGATWRRVRIEVMRLRARLRGTANASKWGIELSTDVDLDPFELAVLRLYADLAPGYSLTAREAAAALRKSARDVRALLEVLKRRALLNRALGGPDDESSYTLSEVGRASLVLKQLAPRR
jgi:hypothetical protein